MLSSIGIYFFTLDLNVTCFTVQPGASLKHAKEGTESSAFWFALGGKQNYTSKKFSPEIVRDPHLFTFSLNKGDSFPYVQLLQQQFNFVFSLCNFVRQSEIMF